MEVYTSVTVKTASVLQANAFADVFLEELSDSLTRNLEDVMPDLEWFRESGGSLCLDEFMFDDADSHEWAFRDIFLKTARAVPNVPFEAEVIVDFVSFMEKVSFVFTYSDGILKRTVKELVAHENIERVGCPACGAEFPEPVYMDAWLDSSYADEAVFACPNCGKKPFSDEEIERYECGCYVTRAEESIDTDF